MTNLKFCAIINTAKQRINIRIGVKMKVVRESASVFCVSFSAEDIRKIKLDLVTLFDSTMSIKNATLTIAKILEIEPVIEGSTVDFSLDGSMSTLKMTILSEKFRTGGDWSNFGLYVAKKWESKYGNSEDKCSKETKSKKTSIHYMGKSDGSVTDMFSEIVPKDLSMYLTDLTTKALEEKTVVFCREDEINRVVQVLQRRNKRNVCLLGEAGVGKTTIVEGLATKIVEGDVPDDMKGRHILALELSAMLAGAKYRGDFEDRLQRALNFVESQKNAIVFIDEIHTIVNTGAAEGAMDAASILKPLLTKSDIQIIGATTFAEYKATLERDKALARRFQNVAVSEPTKEQAQTIVLKSKAQYENYHDVKIGEDRVSQIVELADRYLPDRHFPDKAFDVLDEACVRAKRDKVEEITENHVMEVISIISRIPITKIQESDIEKLNALEDKLKANVLGQDDAIRNIVRAIKRNRVGISETNKPIGSFLFVGTTGTGKTELAKALAREWYGTENALIKVDMSEFMEKHSISQLIGSPAGYVGYEQGGSLTQKVKTQPYSVVLFDEVEKAHPDVLNLLLQLLDEGVLTDTYSGKVNFRNTIVILTSNIGATDAATVKTVGFAQQETTARTDVFKNAVQKYFKPELFNRIDSIVYFNDLQTDVVKDIAYKILDELKERVKKVGYKLEYTEEAVDYLIKGGYSKKYGVRELKRYIASNAESKIADKLIDGVKQDSVLLINCVGNELVIEEKQEQVT